MLVKFNMSTQSYRRGDVVDLPLDDSLHSLLARDVVSEFRLIETKPEPPVAMKKKRTRKNG